MKRLLLIVPTLLLPIFVFRVWSEPMANSDPPRLTIHDVVVAENHQNARPVLFTVELSAPSPQVVTVHYATADGTARPGSDYIHTNGILTFVPGATSAVITVVLLPDPIRELEQDFYLNLSDAVGATVADPVGRAFIVELRINQLIRSGADLQLRFNTGTGSHYRVERRTELGQGGWLALPGAEDVPGLGRPVTVVDPGALLLPQNFYRVIQLP